MAEIIRPAGSAGEASSRLDELSDFPFYGVLLYEPPAGSEGVAEGLDRKVRDYVVANWDSLNAMTGDDLALVVLEDIGSLFSRAARSQLRPPAEARPFRREQVYEVVGMLGIDAAALPCLYLFSGSQSQAAVVVELRRFVTADVGVDELHQLFRTLATACRTVNEEARGKSPAKRVRKLRSEVVTGGFPGTVTRIKIQDGATTVAAVIRVVAELLGLKAAAS